MIVRVIIVLLQNLRILAGKTLAFYMTLKTLQLLICLATCSYFIFSCQKEYQPGNIPVAHGSLHDSSGNCLQQTVTGTYYNGIKPGTDTAFVSLQVNVASTGAYAIKTSTENGYYFADTGYFSNTGLNTVKLKPYGIPAAVKADVFSVTVDSTTCQFTVTVKDSTGTGLGGGSNNPATTGSWEFATDSGGYFHGNILYADLKPDSVYWNTIVSPNVTGGTILRVQGVTPVGDSTMLIYILFPGNAIIQGNYQTQFAGTDTLGKAIFAFGVMGEDASIYDALPDHSEPNTNVNITVNYNPATKIVSGTFSGTANDQAYWADDRKIGIVNGKFSAILK